MGVLETGRGRDGTLGELEAWAVCSYDVFGPLSLMDPLPHVRFVYLPFQLIFTEYLKSSAIQPKLRGSIRSHPPSACKE